jgi:hypothetical protein
VSTLANPAILRPILNGLATRLDGKPYAPSVTSRRRKILNAVIEYAIELKLLDANPIPALKWTPPRPSLVVDPRGCTRGVQSRSS